MAHISRPTPAGDIRRGDRVQLSTDPDAEPETVAWEYHAAGESVFRTREGSAVRIKSDLTLHLVLS